MKKIRDFVESQAKIILITSIPQDVFIASGATVKPSLLFFKKFTEAEAQDYFNITQKAQKLVSKKYNIHIEPIKQKLALRGKEALSKIEKKDLNNQLNQWEEKIAEEIKAQIKADFNYQIPIAEVEKAGISTTGAEIENELIPLAEEFKKYREEKYRENNALWHVPLKEIRYEVKKNDINRVRVYEDKIFEPEPFYTKT